MLEYILFIGGMLTSSFQFNPTFSGGITEGLHKKQENPLKLPQINSPPLASVDPPLLLCYDLDDDRSYNLMMDDTSLCQHPNAGA